MRAATVVQVAQDLFLFYYMFYFTWYRSFTEECASERAFGIFSLWCFWRCRCAGFFKVNVSYFSLIGLLFLWLLTYFINNHRLNLSFIVVIMFTSVLTFYVILYHSQLILCPVRTRTATRSCRTRKCEFHFYSPGVVRRRRRCCCRCCCVWATCWLKVNN